MTSVIILICVTSAGAQGQAAIKRASAQANSCMMMSDSMSTALGLSAEQKVQVKAADERCVKACEAVGYGTTGKVDEAAMRDHDADMEDVLTTAQYTRWSAMCAATKVHGGSKAPVKY